MKFAKPLYLSDGLRDSKRLRMRLRYGKVRPGLHLIALNRGRDELDIYPAILLRQRLLRKSAPRVVGLAGSYEEALLLVEKMVKETYAKTGGYRLRAYLEQRFAAQKKGGAPEQKNG